MSDEKKEQLDRLKKTDEQAEQVASLLAKDIKQNNKTKGGPVYFYQGSTWVVKQHASSSLD